MPRPFKAPHRTPPSIVARGLADRWLAAKLTVLPVEQLDDACHLLDADGRQDPAIVEAARAATLRRRGLPHAERKPPTQPIVLTPTQKRRHERRAELNDKSTERVPGPAPATKPQRRTRP
jgi:hypothetical protein